MEPEAHFVVVEIEEDRHKGRVRSLRMDASFWPTFGLLLIAMSLTVTGELLLKHGMNQHGELNVSVDTLVATAVRLFTSPWVIGGFAFVFSGALFWLAVLSRWDLSLAYPLLSISYIIGMTASVIFLGEKVTWVRVLGVLVIIVGVFLISREAAGK